MSEPSPLFFAADNDCAPASARPTPSAPEPAPRALAFPEAPVRRPATSESSGPPVASPRALTLPEAPALAKPKPQVAPATLFAAPAHPAFAAAQQAAAALEPEFHSREADRIGRRIAELLPVKEATLSTFAARPLETGRTLTLTTATLAQRFAALSAPELLNQAVASVTGTKAGFLGRVRERFSASPSDFIPKVTAMQGLLHGLRDDLAPIRAKAHETDARLRAHLVALRAVEQVAGRGGDAVLLDIMHRKLDVLRAACMQAQLTAAQCAQIDQTLAGLLAQCEQLLNVTLSAAALLKAGQMRP